jgi:hypothetical protein
MIQQDEQDFLSKLYGITPNDPLTFVGVALLPGRVALVGCWLPTRRATRARRHE